MAFTTLILANLGLIHASRSRTRLAVASVRTPNAPLWIVSCAALAFLGLVLYVPPLQDAFHMSALGSDRLAICLLAAVGCLGWFDLVKMLTIRATARR